MSNWIHELTGISCPAKGGNGTTIQRYMGTEAPTTREGEWNITARRRKVLQHPECNEAWKNRVAGVRAERSYRDYDAINGESTEFEWNIFPGFTTLQLCNKVSDLLSYLGQTPETFTGRILFMSMFNDISCDREGNKDECLRNANIVKTFGGRFGIGQWSFIRPGSSKFELSLQNSELGSSKFYVLTLK